LVNDTAYRLGDFEVELVGIPTLVPGRFIQLQSFGDEVSNTFYVTSVRHVFDSDRGYTTRLKGKTSSVELSVGSGVGL
ncbi:MAG: hypothetical protein K6F00_04310, partial [Lachnospiraceae bacterium]|nr:hypothetical protein [Lachnospiraceae bacterium]